MVQDKSKLVPMDIQQILTRLPQRKGPFGKAQVTATVEGTVVAEGIVTYGLVTVDGATSVNR